VTSIGKSRTGPTHLHVKHPNFAFGTFSEPSSASDRQPSSVPFPVPHLQSGTRGKYWSLVMLKLEDVGRNYHFKKSSRLLLIDRRVLLIEPLSDKNPVARPGNSLAITEVPGHCTTLVNERSIGNFATLY